MLEEIGVRQRWLQVPLLSLTYIYIKDIPRFSHANTYIASIKFDYARKL